MIQSNPDNEAEAKVLDDFELVRQAQDGQLDAFTSLYERHLPAVFQRVRYVIPEHDIEDVTQEIFITMMNSLKSFKGKSSFSTWLRTLTNRRVADYYRKRAREADAINVDISEMESSLKAERPSQADMANVIDERIMLRSALSKLPEHYQEVLLLRFAEGLKFNEIANELDQSLEATKSLFRRAIAAMRNEV